MGDEKNSWWDGSSTTKKWKDFGILYIKNMYIYTVYILYYIYMYIYIDHGVVKSTHVKENC